MHYFHHLWHQLKINKSHSLEWNCGYCTSQLTMSEWMWRFVGSSITATGLFFFVEFWVPLLLDRLLISSTHTPPIFTVTHHSSQRPITASPPFNCLHLRHSVCVAMAILQRSTHTVSFTASMEPTCGRWCRLAAHVISSLGKKTYFYHWAQSIPRCPTYLWNRI